LTRVLASQEVSNTGKLPLLLVERSRTGYQDYSGRLIAPPSDGRRTEAQLRRTLQQQSDQLPFLGCAQQRLAPPLRLSSPGRSPGPPAAHGWYTLWRTTPTRRAMAACVSPPPTTASLPAAASPEHQNHASLDMDSPYFSDTLMGDTLLYCARPNEAWSNHSGLH